jgi:hypothetical protein
VGSPYLEPSLDIIGKTGIFTSKSDSCTSQFTISQEIPEDPPLGAVGITFLVQELGSDGDTIPRTKFLQWGPTE